MTYLGTLAKQHVGSRQVNLKGRMYFLPRPVTLSDVGRYVRKVATDEGTIIEIERDDQYAKRIRAANRRHRGG